MSESGGSDDGKTQGEVVRFRPPEGTPASAFDDRMTKWLNRNWEHIGDARERLSLKDREEQFEQTVLRNLRVLLLEEFYQHKGDVANRYQQLVDYFTDGIAKFDAAIKEHRKKKESTKRAATLKRRYTLMAKTAKEYLERVQRGEEA